MAKDKDNIITFPVDRKEECIKELKELMNAKSIVIISKELDDGIHVTFRGENISHGEAIQMYAFGTYLTYKNFLKKE